MKRFINFKSYELISAQNDIENIYNLKRNNYISDLNEGEIQEIKFYKELFEEIAQDFRNMEI
jgi:hypothetical protein